MNALLIYPEFPDTFWSFKHALKFIKKRASSPPLGIITVAAMLPDSWNKRLVDLNVSRLKRSDLAWADYVFVSAMVIQRASARAVIKKCKAAGLPVIAGGPLFTNEHAEFPEVDHFVLNEAEPVMPGFIRDLEADSAQRFYKCDEFPDVKTTPVPQWDLLDLRHYASMSIQYSRGCPFNCEFCNVTALFGHKPRIKSARQIIGELDSLYAIGWRDGIFFVDDNFIGNKKMLKTNLLPAIMEWRADKPAISFNTEVSINIADDPELMRMMVQAGFHTVFIGIETPDEAGLAECSKLHNINRDLTEDVKKIQRAGLQVQGGFIVGFDSDTPSIFRRQIEFIQNSGIVTAMIGLLQAPPGTRLYARMKEQGRILLKPTGDNVDGTTNIVPTMNAAELKDGYLAVLRYIYAPKNYYKRIKTFLKEYKAPAVKAPMTFARAMSFVRSMFIIGILGKERFHYWGLLIWARFRKPEVFGLAVTLAIYGYHFRKVCSSRVSRACK